MTRALALTFFGLWATNASAADWRVQARYAVGTGVDAHSSAPLTLDQNVAISPVAIGPLPELALGFEAPGQATLSRLGLGVRQNVIGGFSLASHALMLTHTGSEVGHATGFGLQGVADLELVRSEGAGGGLHLHGGWAPGDEVPRWWAGIGVGIRFGG